MLKFHNSRNNHPQILTVLTSPWLDPSHREVLAAVLSCTLYQNGTNNLVGRTKIYLSWVNNTEYHVAVPRKILLTKWSQKHRTHLAILNHLTEIWIRQLGSFRRNWNEFCPHLYNNNETTKTLGATEQKYIFWA